MDTMTAEHPDATPEQAELHPRTEETTSDSPPSDSFIPMATPATMGKPVAPPPDPARPLGFWATIGLSVALAIVFFIAQAVPFVIALGSSESHNHDMASILARAEELENDGQLMCWSTVASTIGTVVFLAPVLWLARRSFRQYLAIDWPPRKTLMQWLLILVAFMIVEEGFNLAVGQATIHDFMIASYETASLPLLILGISICAPFTEEIIIRGFMYRGIAASRAGAITAILLPAALWTVIHVQYESFILAQIFLFGILLGIARYRTGSTTVPIAMHAFNNFASTVQVVIAVEFFGHAAS
jgi:membrane protease YdiL (CAAX protease family)